jgi:hypothetical protein
MRELKTESQSIRTTQGSAGLKRSKTSRTVAPAREETVTEKTVTEKTATEKTVTESGELIEEKSLSPDIASPPKQGRKTTPEQTAAKTKRATTTQAKQIASTQVKLTWETPETLPSERNSFGIAVRFQQLEHELQQLKSQAAQINQQSVEIQTEMAELRTIAHEVTLPKSLGSDRKSNSEPSMPSFMRQAPIRQNSPIPNPSVQNSPAQSSPIQSSPLQNSSIRPETFSTPDPPIKSSAKSPIADSTLASLKSLRNPSPRSSRRRRPRSLRGYFHRLAFSLALPKQPIAIVCDALLWTLAAAGFRIGLGFLIHALPILATPMSLLMFVPAIAAAYLAVFVPRSSPITLYRLLLVTLGLFVGGKLL